MDNIELALTNRRIMGRYGFISKKEFKIKLSNVESANFSKKSFVRILNFGKIIVNCD